MSRFNIYLRRDGRWEARIYDTFSEGSQKIRKYLYARNKEQCERLVRAYLQNERRSISRNCSFYTIYKAWKEDALHRVKASTLANYSMKAKKHILPYFGNFLISDISQEDVYDFISQKLKSGLSSRYISDMIILIKNIFKFAVKIYHIFNPLDGIVLPKKKPADIRLLDESEQKKLQRYTAKNKNFTSLGISLCMATGIRIGELCALQWKDIDLEKRILTVSKTMQRIQAPTDSARTKLIITEPKSDTSQRLIPLPKCVMKMLRKFANHGDNFILSGTDKPVEPRTMQYRFQRILKNVNLPSIHFHALRHMFASNAIRLGFDVKMLSEILGHSSVEITLNRYVHSSFSQKQEYMDRIKFLR